MTRREDLAEAATDYVLEFGLVGLSLRPLAEALGTSDRMLIYHFGSKDDLVAAIMRKSNDRCMSLLATLPAAADVHDAVLDFWQAMTSTLVAACSRLYVEAAALGYLGREPYATVLREVNQEWMAAVARQLVASGAGTDRADRVAALVEATVMGLFLDAPLDPPEAQRRVVEDLADAAAALAAQ